MIKNRSEEEIRDHYDSKKTDNPMEAQDYVIDGKPIDYSRYKSLVIDSVVQKLELSSKHKVLDVGCGAGLILAEIEKRVAYAEGIDISQNLLDMFKGKSKLRCGSVRELELRKDFYDRIYMISVAIHFPNGDYFKEIFFRLLKSVAPGGMLMIGDQLISDFYESPKYFSIGLRDLMDLLKESRCHFSLLTQDEEIRARNRYDILVYKPK